MARFDIAPDGPHPIDRHVGRRLAEVRIQRGFSQTELGKALGLTFQQVQKYEKGANRISASKLWLAADFLHVEIAYFFEGVQRKHGDGRGAGPGADGIVTRATLESSRLLPTLSPPQQRLILEMIRQLSAGNAPARSDAA